MILETLYLPRVKDQLAGLNQRRWTYVYDVSAGDTVFNSGAVAPVPVDTLRMVETLGYWIVPGGLLTATDVMFYCSSGLRYIGITGVGPLTTTGGADTRGVFTDLSWLMGPGDTLTVDVAFSANTSINRVLAVFSGYEVPRANVEL